MRTTRANRGTSAFSPDFGAPPGTFRWVPDPRTWAKPGANIAPAKPIAPRTHRARPRPPSSAREHVSSQWEEHPPRKFAAVQGDRRPAAPFRAPRALSRDLTECARALKPIPSSCFDLQVRATAGPAGFAPLNDTPRATDRPRARDTVREQHRGGADRSHPSHEPREQPQPSPRLFRRSHIRPRTACNIPVVPAKRAAKSGTATPPGERARQQRV